MKFYAGIGSRKTPSAVLRLMRVAARRLAENDWVLRTGGAEGADIAFEQGAFDGEAHIYLPWATFNSDLRTGGERHYVTSYPSIEARKIAEQFHPAFHKLTAGGQALQARNTHQVLGADCKSPASFILCYTENASGGGGTGQALRIARAHDIEVFDLGDTNTRSRLEAWLG